MDAIYTSDQQRDAHAALKKLYDAAMREGCGLAEPTDRRAACDAAHINYEVVCEALGIDLPPD